MYFFVLLTYWPKIEPKMTNLWLYMCCFRFCFRSVTLRDVLDTMQQQLGGRRSSTLPAGQRDDEKQRNKFCFFCGTCRRLLITATFFLFNEWTIALIIFVQFFWPITVSNTTNWWWVITSLHKEYMFGCFHEIFLPAILKCRLRCHSSAF